MKKDTIYIDIEDDITSIIDKLKNAKSKVVALVPPKRSTTLNSVVNLKLLIKAAEEADKRPVLVTSETALLNLAGGVGLYAASNLHSKPFIPKDDQAPKIDDSVIDGSEVDPNLPIGQLDTVHTATSEAKTGQPIDSATAKKGFKIPSFDRFRQRLFLIIGGVILLILGWWWAFFLAPKAIIAINAQTSSEDIVFEFTADTAATADDFTKNIFIAEAQQLEDTLSQQFTPTGKKNVGDKATGSLTVRNCDTSDSFSLPAGTIATSPDDFKFEFLEAVDVPGGSFSGGGCSSPGEATVNVRAIAPGADYNLGSGTIYDIDGVGSLVDGEGSQMSGGTDKNVTVVSQKDIDTAKQKLAEGQGEDDVSAMREKFGDDMVPINETYQIKLGTITASPGVGQEAETGTVSAKATQTMLAVKRDTLAKALDDFLNAKLSGGDQVIFNNGLNDLVFTLVSKSKNPQAELRLNTTGHIGPNLNTEQLARDIAGKRYSETVNYIQSRPGVKEVDVNFEPFWVFTAPRESRIEFILNIDDSGQN